MEVIGHHTIGEPGVDADINPGDDTIDVVWHHEIGCVSALYRPFVTSTSFILSARIEESVL